MGEFDKREETLAALERREFDFLDFGCSRGGSIDFGIKKLNGKFGLGLDIDAAKVKSAQLNGVAALQMDVTTLDSRRNCVSFVLMFHFLEHLPGYRTALKCIQSACLAARDFVVIRQPWFDSDGHLFQRGLKLYWSDWKGHSYPMSSLDLYRAMRDCKLPVQFRFYGRKPIVDVHDPAIYPLEAPGELQRNEIGMFPPKPGSAISVPTFYELQCVILRSQRYTFSELEKRLAPQSLLFEGSSRVANEA